MEFAGDREIVKPDSLTFSVIMPCYNSEDYVTDALESIVNQTYSNWELVAVNDGSTDSTLNILQNYAAKDDRIKVYSKPNGGYVSAVNLGLEKITGDYFLLMGSDDRLAENLFYELSQNVINEHSDCIAFRTIIVQDGKTLGIESITNFTGAASMFNTTLSEYIRTYPSHAAIFLTRDTSKCYKRTLLGSLRYFGQYGFDADGIFSMLLCHNATSFSSIPVDGYFWTLRGDSLSGRKSSYAQDCDRIENWTIFYNRLLKLDTAEITSTEKEYLYYFLEIVSSTWKVSRPFFAQYKLIYHAAKIIRKIVKKTNYPLSLSHKSILLLYSPIAWKLYMGLLDRYFK